MFSFYFSVWIRSHELYVKNPSAQSNVVNYNFLAAMMMLPISNFCLKGPSRAEPNEPTAARIVRTFLVRCEQLRIFGSGKLKGRIDHIKNFKLKP